VSQEVREKKGEEGRKEEKKIKTKRKKKNRLLGRK
jgi:hypothetical protein